MRSCLLLVFLSVLPLLFSAEPADVRLVNGSSPCSGRVEVFRWGEWGTVYQRNWDMNDAMVVCRQLGCGSAVSVPGAAHFGEGSGRMVLGDVSCSGSESALRECGSLDGREHYLPHTLDAAVICSDHVRLVGGADRCSGWLEVKFSQSWATVCDGNFDWQDAEVVCRELDCGAPSALHKGAQSDQGEGPIWSKGFHCDGEELFLHECFTSAKSEQNCEKNSNIRLICTGPEDLRLVNGSSPCSGRVEVYRWGEWGTIAQYDWDLDDASVVCRQLGCGTAVLAPIRAHFGEGSRRVLLRDVSCSGSESALRECRSQDFRYTDFLHIFDAGIICSDHVRLVGGADRCSGRLEVKLHQSWATVCDDNFDWQDAEVVCRELDCGAPSALHKGAHFGEGEGPIWYKDFHCEGHESFLHECLMSVRSGQNCTHGHAVGLTCTGHVDLKMVGGGSPCAGIEQIYRWGKWWTPAAPTDLDTIKKLIAVVGRQLGCGSLDFFQTSEYSPNFDNILLGEDLCNGSEANLMECKMDVFSEIKFLPLVFHAIVFTGHRGIQLIGGSHMCSGRVEIQHGKSWGSVCDADFDWQDAEVVCRSLGCGEPAQLLEGAAFGQGEGGMWSEEFQCQGNESHLVFCPKLIHNKTCRHENDVGLVCSGYSRFRLRDGPDLCSGRVEMRYNGTWGTLCDASWDMRAATVLCQQLECGSAVAALGQAWFGGGTGPIWPDVFHCQGNETRLSQCAVSPWRRTACSHGEDAGVICSGSTPSSSDGGVRLQSGGSDCEGWVEVYYNQTWQKVHQESWSSMDASVVCRQLGCGSATNIYRSYLSRTGDSDKCVTGFHCSGTESHLGKCRPPHVLNCRPSDQVSMVCSNHRSLRLVGGGSDCAGRLEVFHRGSWGTVCHESWGLPEAQVVCRQLHCGTALSGQIPVPTYFGPGTGPIWLSKLGCGGNESSLAQGATIV
ncbi:scavenger receptor cysteine-rich type 1 protein M130-like [Paramormyrops kingsleyae]|uniref:scavenger receptor cysteine-rich type 1 protein M130-like n=1 Tax=Paramormyrops kingsleyae TaxID=1676925 RepID=UPI003B975768